MKKNLVGTLTLATALFLPPIMSSQALLAAPAKKEAISKKKSAPAPRKTAPKKPASPAPRPAANRVLWDRWYTVTVNQKIKYAYYNEKFEIKDSKVHLQTRLWKQEEGFINEENMGAFSTNDATLTPIVFNITSTYRSTETTIDGSVEANPSGRLVINVRARKGGTDLKPVKRALPKGTIFSAFFPIWIQRNFAQLKTGKPVRFYSVLEDNIDAGFKTLAGTVRLAEPDPFAKLSKTHRVSIKYSDLSTTWWVHADGSAEQIMIPSQKTVIKRTTKEAAEKFFSESGS